MKKIVCIILSALFLLTALVSCADLDRTDADQIIGMLTYEFPVREIVFTLPDWIAALPEEHRLRAGITDDVMMDL